MSTFLTPPVWYDKNGTLNEMLTGKSGEAGNIVIGSNAEASSFVFNSVVIGGSAIGTETKPFSSAIVIGDGALADGSGAITIGGGSSATAAGAIAIGSAASVTSQNTIQLGGNNTAYTLQVGNGTGTLGIGSIKFQKMTINSNKVSLSSQGVYLCCTTKNSVSGIVICFIGDLSGNATVLESSTNLCTYVASDIGTGSQVHQIQASSGVTINYCFKIINI